MNNERPQIGDLVEITGLPEPTTSNISGESSDARGLLMKLRADPYNLGATPDKFVLKPDEPGKVVKDARTAAKWTIAYGQLDHM